MALSAAGGGLAPGASADHPKGRVAALLTRAATPFLLAAAIVVAAPSPAAHAAQPGGSDAVEPCSAAGEVISVRLKRPEESRKSDLRAGEYESARGAADRDGDEKVRFCLEPGERFAVHFTHSVELTWVAEEYEARDGELVMVATEYSSYGAGLPFGTEGGRFLPGEESYRLEGLDRAIGRELSFLTYPVNDWRISYPDPSGELVTYSFECSKLGTAVSIAVATGRGEA